MTLRTRRVEDLAFLAFILAVSIALAWIIQPFAGAVLWGAIAAILFTPLNDRLLRTLPRHPSLAAFLTLLVIVAMVVVPAILLAFYLVREAAHIYAQIQSGEMDPGAYFLQFQSHLPQWARNLLAGWGVTDFDGAAKKLTAGIASSFQALTAQALSFGQGLFGFVIDLGAMLYLTFFLLRDGKAIAARIEHAIPLQAERRTALIAKFLTVVRATIKGSLVVALCQGTLGGMIFWMLGIRGALLWGVCMAFFSLIPVIGTGLIWIPVAAYLLITGSIWQGVVLVLCGLFVIGLIDNLVRPILVGRDARMPDYAVLFSTLGGLEILGFNGVVIGPVIAALFIAAWDIFVQSRSDDPALGHS